jgi:hypothetical protein
MLMIALQHDLFSLLVLCVLLHAFREVGTGSARRHPRQDKAKTPEIAEAPQAACSPDGKIAQGQSAPNCESDSPGALGRRRSQSLPNLGEPPSNARDTLRVDPSPAKAKGGPGTEKATKQDHSLA